MVEAAIEEFGRVDILVNKCRHRDRGAGDP
jgi:hypothetical protein